MGEHGPAVPSYVRGGGTYHRDYSHLRDLGEGGPHKVSSDGVVSWVPGEHKPMEPRTGDIDPNTGRPISVEEPCPDGQPIDGDILFGKNTQPPPKPSSLF